MSVVIAEVIDLKDLVCPMPILKTKQALMRVNDGDIIQVLVTDSHAEVDFKAFLSRSTHLLLDYSLEGVTHSFIIKKRHTD